MKLLGLTWPWTPAMIMDYFNWTFSKFLIEFADLSYIYKIWSYMYELQCNILEGLLSSIYDNHFYKRVWFHNIMQFHDIREYKYFYKFKLKHYKETSWFIIDKRPSITVWWPCIDIQLLSGRKLNRKIISCNEIYFCW